MEDQNQIVVAGPASQKLAVKVAHLLNAQLYSTESKVFPDGECYLRVQVEDDGEFRGKEVTLIQSTAGNAWGDQNLHIMEIIMMISAVRRMDASKIRVVIPYFAYSRQDKAFRPGESIFAQDLLRWMQAAGATEFYSIDIHTTSIFKVLTIPAYNLDPMKVLAEEVKSRNLANPVVICPDKGAFERSRAFARYLGDAVPVVQLNKKRDVITGKTTMEGTLQVEGKDVIIADDIIATGGTMALALGIAKKAGASSIYAIGTHPLLIKNAVFKLLNAGVTEIIGTDTLSSIAMQASMAEVIAAAIQEHLS